MDVGYSHPRPKPWSQRSSPSRVFNRKWRHIKWRKFTHCQPKCFAHHVLQEKLARIANVSVKLSSANYVQDNNAFALNYCAKVDASSTNIQLYKHSWNDHSMDWNNCFFLRCTNGSIAQERPTELSHWTQLESSFMFGSQEAHIQLRKQNMPHTRANINDRQPSETTDDKLSPIINSITHWHNKSRIKDKDEPLGYAKIRQDSSTSCFIYFNSAVILLLSIRWLWFKKPTTRFEIRTTVAPEIQQEMQIKTIRIGASRWKTSNKMKTVMALFRSFVTFWVWLLNLPDRLSQKEKECNDSEKGYQVCRVHKCACSKHSFPNWVFIPAFNFDWFHQQSPQLPSRSSIFPLRLPPYQLFDLHALN